MANNKLRTLVTPDGSAYDVTVPVSNSAPTLAWNTTSTIGTVDGVDLTVKMPANPNSNTTYTVATGDSNGQIKVTPSSGSAYNVNVKGLGSAAYTASTDYATKDHTHTTIDGTKIVGVIPTECLPSYVDDVLEYTAKASFPTTGETGKIYVDTSTNKTYRWSGSTYVEISASLALGETSSTAYRGDRGKTAYDHSQKTSGNPHNVTKSDVGLGSVDNTADAVKHVAYADEAGNAATVNNLTVLKAVPADAKFTDTIYTHPTYTAKSNGFYKVTVDNQGHVSGTAAVTKTDITSLGIPDSDTHYTTNLYATSSGGTSNATTTNGNTYLRLFDNTTPRSSIKIAGSGATTVVSDAQGNITISSTDTNTHPTVVNNAPTLDWGTTSTVGSVGGTNLTVKLPSNPCPLEEVDNELHYEDNKVALIPVANSIDGLLDKDLGGYTLYFNTDTDYTDWRGMFYYGETFTSTGGYSISIGGPPNVSLVKTTDPSYTPTVIYSYDEGNVWKVSSLTLPDDFGQITRFVSNAAKLSLSDMIDCSSIIYSPSLTKYIRTVLHPVFENSGVAVSSSSSDIISHTPTINSLTTETGRYYGIECDATGQLYVNVPWTDTYVTQGNTADTSTSTFALTYSNSTATNSTTTSLRRSSKLQYTPNTGSLSLGTSGTAGSGKLTVYGDIIAGGGNDNYGVHPATDNYSSLGKADKKWYKVYASTYYEGTTALSSKYEAKGKVASTNTSSKIYLVGATSQGSSQPAYSHDTAYVGSDGHLYSNSAKVLSKTYAPEAFLSWGGQSVSGAVTPIGAALSSEHSANRLAFLNPAALSMEYSNDGGSTWTSTSWADAGKIQHVTTQSSIPVGSASTVTTNHRTRVTLSAQDGTKGYVYTRPRKLLINVSNAGHGMNVLIEYKTGVSGASWKTLGTYALSGWSGWNDIDVSALTTLGGGNTQTGNNWYLRLTYGVTSVNSDYATTKATVLGVRLFGDTCWIRTSNMGETGHLYSYDYEQNAIFPAKVTATKFEGNIDDGVLA